MTPFLQVPRIQLTEQLSFITILHMDLIYNSEQLLFRLYVEKTRVNAHPA